MTMIVEDPKTAKFEIVLVSSDPDHARLLLADLNTSRSPFLVTVVSERRRIGPALDRLVATPPRPLPVIVMLDFEFLGDACESLAAHVVEMQTKTAIECVVTRPPATRGVADRLSRMGAFLFDPDAEFVLAERALQ